MTSRPGPRRVSVGATVRKRPFHSIFSERLESLTYSIALERSQRLDSIFNHLAFALSTEVVFFWFKDGKVAPARSECHKNDHS